MAYILFAVFMSTPLVILGVNLGRSAAGPLRRALSPSTAPAGSRRPRGKVTWPLRPVERRTAPVDVARSMSPLAALRRSRAPRETVERVPAPAAPIVAVAPPQVVATRPAPVRPDVSLLAAASAPQPLVAAPLPVTASTYGWVPAPASAFEAGPALTPRRGAEVIAFPERPEVRDLAEAR